MTPSEVRANFPADPASAGLARRFLDATLRGWRCDHYLDVASLLVSELVANAVLHAGTSILVVVRLDSERLRVEVHDGNARLPTPKHYSPMSATGRGLLLVERMSDQWGVVPSGSGKIVWFELDPDMPPRQADYVMFNLDEFDLSDLDDLGSARPNRPSDGSEGSPAAALRPDLRVLVAGGL